MAPPQERERASRPRVFRFCEKANEVAAPPGKTGGP